MFLIPQRGDDMTQDSRPAVLELIGNTPLVRVSRFDTGPCTLFLKLESQNPGGSIKDRIGLAMIDAAERDGRLGPGGTIVEATAGNTGLGLALVGRAKGYRVVLVVPDKMSTEKILHLKAMGAEVHITRSDVGQSAGPRMQHRAGNLGTDATRSGRHRGRRRLGGHTHRAHPVLSPRAA
jgi:cystathionine beta-synthase